MLNILLDICAKIYLTILLVKESLGLVPVVGYCECHSEDYAFAFSTWLKSSLIHTFQFLCKDQQGHACHFSTRKYFIINQIHVPHLSLFWALGLRRWSDQCFTIIGQENQDCHSDCISCLHLHEYLAQIRQYLTAGHSKWKILCSHQNLGNHVHSNSHALSTYYAWCTSVKSDSNPGCLECISLLSCLERLSDWLCG